MRISPKNFEDAVERAIEMIPELFRDHLGNIAIIVEGNLRRKLLMEMDIPADEAAFGVFTGVPLPERSIFEQPLYPDEIIIFREPLMEAGRSLEELEKEIAVTVIHEVAHFMGLSEERLEELGYG